MPYRGCVSSVKLLYLSKLLVNLLEHGHYTYFYRDTIKIK